MMMEVLVLLSFDLHGTQVVPTIRKPVPVEVMAQQWYPPCRIIF